MSMVISTGKYFSLKLLIILLLFAVANSILASNIITKELFYNSYEGKLPEKVISEMLSFEQQHEWIAYLVTPIIILFKICVVSCCIWVGAVLSSLDTKFHDIWWVVIASEFVNVVFSFIRTILLYSNHFKTISEISQYNPFDLVGYIDFNGIDEIFRYPLQIVSIPEIFYWIILSLLLKFVIKQNFNKNLWLVTKTYGVSLILGISLVIFLHLNMSL